MSQFSYDPETEASLKRLRKEIESDEECPEARTFRDFIVSSYQRSNPGIAISAAAATAGAVHGIYDALDVSLNLQVPIFYNLENLLTWGPTIAGGIRGIVQCVKRKEISSVLVDGALEATNAAVKTLIGYAGGRILPYVARGLSHIKG